jgi:hypothetical protein
MRSISAVVDEFDIFCTSISPHEAEPPLRVHADAVLTTTVAHQSLEPIPRRDPQIFELLRGVDEFEFPQDCPLHRSFDALR